MMSLHVLIQEMQAIRDKFEEWIYYHVFEPVAEKNKFYVIKDGIKEYLYPKIHWYKSLDIEEEDEERKEFQTMHQKGLISTKTLFGKYRNLDAKDEAKQLSEEQGTVFDKKDGRIPEQFKKIDEREMLKSVIAPMMTTPVAPIEPIAPKEPVKEVV
jgi:hypothetical protein